MKEPREEGNMGSGYVVTQKTYETIKLNMVLNKESTRMV